jgi:hypothetical protein
MTILVDGMVLEENQTVELITQEFRVGGYPWFSYIKLKNRLFIQLRLI